jgi:predicted TIM-barrel enzyme
VFAESLGSVVKLMAKANTNLRVLDVVREVLEKKLADLWRGTAIIDETIK